MSYLFKPNALFAFSIITLACGGDGGTSGTEGASATETTGSTGAASNVTSDGETEATTVDSTTTNTGTDTTDTTETDATTTTDTDSTDTDSTDTAATETSDTTDTTDTSDDTDTDTDTDTTDQPVCEGEGQLPAEWYLSVVDGVFPNDVPENLDESCEVVEGQGFRLACPSVEFDLLLTAMPMPMLPAPGAQAHVRLHHEPGWLNWPDLWISVDVVDGDAFAFQSSSVLHPTQGDYTVPWAPSRTPSECGPFLLEDMFGEDGCGEQVGYELRFEVDDETVNVWHGMHQQQDIGGVPFEVWVGASREYLDTPETCDTSPRWFSVVTRRG